MLAALLVLGAQASPTLSSDGNGACWDHGRWFREVGAELGVRGFGNSHGVNLNDFNGDGRPDIFVAMGPGRAEGAAYYSGESLLYLQQEDGSFVEAGADYGLDSLCEDRAPLYGDLDGDGLPDLYLTVNGQNALYRNEGFAWFQDVTAQGGAAGHPGWGHQGVLFDADRDGWLDIFFSNGPEDGSSPSVLLMNQRDGSFRDATAEAGIQSSSSGEGVCVLDVNLDGWPDLFQTNGRGHNNQLFVNQGDGTFVDEAIERGLVDPLRRFSFGAACGDLDNDGDPDIVAMTHDYMYTGNLILENQDGVFHDAGLLFEEESERALRDRIDPHGLALVDLDQDGLLDVVLSGLVFKPHVFLNQGGLSFQRACGALGIEPEDLLSWSVAASDLSGDGYPEVYISSGLGRRPADDRLYRYEGPAEHHWLEVEVQGRTHNRSALGARIEVETPAGTITRWVGAWSNFQAQGRLPVLIGLGAQEVASQVRVEFTNGVQVVLDEVPADQRLVVEEPIGAADADADTDGVPDGWDACPGTVLGRPTDGEGCARGQRGGVAVAGSEPLAHGVVTDCFHFRWSGEEGVSAVVQVSGDGTFGVGRRVDLGPVREQEIAVCGEELEALRALSDGTRPLLWRVVVAADDDREGQSEARAFYLARPTTEVSVPRGANVFFPAHIVVDQGSTVTWWNDSVSAGNLQDEPHDVQLIDPTGAAVSRLTSLVGGGRATWLFNQPGVWHVLCHMHSGIGTPNDALIETERAHHHRTDGPFRCMAGTVTVR